MEQGSQPVRAGRPGRADWLRLSQPVLRPRLVHHQHRRLRVLQPGTAAWTAPSPRRPRWTSTLSWTGAVWRRPPAPASPRSTSHSAPVLSSASHTVIAVQPTQGPQQAVVVIDSTAYWDSVEMSVALLISLPELAPKQLHYRQLLSFLQPAADAPSGCADPRFQSDAPVAGGIYLLTNGSHVGVLAIGINDTWTGPVNYTQYLNLYAYQNMSVEQLPAGRHHRQPDSAHLRLAAGSAHAAGCRQRRLLRPSGHAVHGMRRHGRQPRSAAVVRLRLDGLAHRHAGPAAAAGRGGGQLPVHGGGRLAAVRQHRPVRRQFLAGGLCAGAG